MPFTTLPTTRPPTSQQTPPPSDFAEDYADNPGFYGTSRTTFPGSRMVAPTRPVEAAAPPPTIDPAPPSTEYRSDDDVGGYHTPSGYPAPPPDATIAAPDVPAEPTRSVYSQAIADRRASGQPVTGAGDLMLDKHPAGDIFERYLRNAAPTTPPVEGIDRAYELTRPPAPTVHPAASRVQSSVSGAGGRAAEHATKARGASKKSANTPKKPKRRTTSDY